MMVPTIGMISSFNYIILLIHYIMFTNLGMSQNIKYKSMHIVATRQLLANLNAQYGV